MRLAEKECGLIDAVDGAIARHARPRQPRDCREQIDAVHDLVADLAGWNAARPANHERHANPTFPGGEVLAAPRSCPAIVRPDELRSVVARKDDDRGEVGG